MNCSLSVNASIQEVRPLILMSSSGMYKEPWKKLSAAVDCMQGKNLSFRWLLSSPVEHSSTSSPFVSLCIPAIVLKCYWKKLRPPWKIAFRSLASSLTSPDLCVT